MIELYTGRPGSGKTLMLTRRVLRALDMGYVVYTNYPIKHEKAEREGRLKLWQDLWDLIELKDGIIVMDEAHVYMNSRKWDALPDDMQVKLQQHRKHGLHIWGTVQHENRIDVVYRELVSRFYVCHKIIGSGSADDPVIEKHLRKSGSTLDRFFLWLRGRMPKVWGLIRVAQFFPEDMSSKSRTDIGAEWVWITRRVVEAYNTKEEISRGADMVQKVRHIRKVCPDCGKEIITHV